jgi:hypothetical protein
VRRNPTMTEFERSQVVLVLNAMEWSRGLAMSSAPEKVPRHGTSYPGGEEQHG